jgi:hypothetical protein
MTLPCALEIARLYTLVRVVFIGGYGYNSLDDRQGHGAMNKKLPGSGSALAILVPIRFPSVRSFSNEDRTSNTSNLSRSKQDYSRGFGFGLEGMSFNATRISRLKQWQRRFSHANVANGSLQTNETSEIFGKSCSSGGRGRMVPYVALNPRGDFINDKTSRWTTFEYIST